MEKQRPGHPGPEVLWSVDIAFDPVDCAIPHEEPTATPTSTQLPTPTPSSTGTAQPTLTDTPTVGLPPPP